MAKTPKVVNRFRGVNKLDRFNIGEEYAMSTKNLTSDKFPALTVRPGQGTLGNSIGTRVLGLGVWKDIELHAVFNDGTWRKWTGTAWSSPLISGLSTTAEFSFTNFKGGLADINLFGTNGVNGLLRYDGGSSVVAVSGPPSNCNFVTQYADRLWIASGNELWASADRDATDWTTVHVPEQDSDRWLTVIESNNGEQISGIQSGLSKLTITKPSSIYQLYGMGTFDFEVRPRSSVFGSLNNKCMEPLNEVLYMMDSNGILKYDGGFLPDSKFSAVVQDYIDNINQSAKGMSCIGSDGKKIYVSIPVNSSTNPDTVLVYDPSKGTWFVWDNMSILHFAKIGDKFFCGDASGRVRQISPLITSDNGVPINWEWISGPITSPIMARLLRWFDGWVTANVAIGSTFNVYISALDSGDSDWKLVKALAANGVVETTPIYFEAEPMATQARLLRVKFSGSGPMDLREWSRNEDYDELR